MAVLQERIMGLPVWGWGLIILGGIAVAVWVLPKLGLGGIGGATGGTTGQTTSGGISDPNIDPVTGVPYSVEEAINPATGLPAYYGAGAGGTLTTTNAPPPPPVQNNNPNPSGQGGFSPGPCGEANPPPGFRCVNGHLQWVGVPGGGIKGQPIILHPMGTPNVGAPIGSPTAAAPVVRRMQ